MKLSKGNRVFKSIKGHNGFCYPSDSDDAMLLINVCAKRLSWVGGKDLIPVLVPQNAVLVAGDPRISVPVWVKKI